MFLTVKHNTDNMLSRIEQRKPKHLDATTCDAISAAPSFRPVFSDVSEFTNSRVFKKLESLSD